jgi:hypothetical protein
VSLTTASRFLIGLLVSGVASAQLPVRFVDAVEVAPRERHIDIAVALNCSARYIAHEPAIEGDTLRVRLHAEDDCGTSISNLIAGPVTAATANPEIFRSMHVEPVVNREVALVIQWARTERFVLASEGRRGLRIRLLRSGNPAGRMLVDEAPAVDAMYAVNLESQREPFEESVVAEAERIARVRPYVSEVMLRGERWYRLRIGPIAREPEARRLLTALRAHFPRAWLAINDQDEPSPDLGESEPDAGVIPAARSATRGRVLSAPERASVLSDARKRFRARDYAAAIPLLTHLVEQSEFPERDEAQELLGLARERLGQLAHAKAEYEEYLTRYPKGRAAKRVSSRLNALRTARRSPRDRTRGSRGYEIGAWTLTGAFAQLYRRDELRIDALAGSNDLTSQHAVLNDGDVFARRRGERFDVTSRVSAGFVKDLLTEGPGDQVRVSSAFAELADRERGWSLRGGRQSRNSGGVLGTFDGAYFGYQYRPRFRLNLTAGLPVDSTLDGLESERQFLGVSVDFGTIREAWDFTFYGLEQRIESMTDRRAVGFEVRYFRPGRTFVGLVDYDVGFNDVNHAILLATQTLPGRWVLSLNADMRKSPLLSTRNALIGQPVTRFDELFGFFTDEEIERLSLDRSADSQTIALSAYRPLGDRFQLTLDASSTQTDGTPASGGVEAVPTLPRDDAFSVQVLGNSLLRSGDVNVLALRYQTGGSADVISAGLSMRWPVGALRVGPRVRVDRRELTSDGARQWLYVPSLRIEHVTARSLVELDLGAERGETSRVTGDEQTDRYYVSAGYRFSF